MTSLCKPRTCILFTVVTILTIVLISSQLLKLPSISIDFVSGAMNLNDKSVEVLLLQLESSQNVSKSTETESGAVPEKAEKKGNDEYPFPPPTLANGYTCNNSMCSEFLTPKDMKAFMPCKRHRNKLLVPHCIKGSCHFMNGTNRSPVALASFPGSGNTWVRGLLELATGVCTGTMYSDWGLRVKGFNGENVKSGAVIAVKTHWFTSQESSGFGGTILIIRNPFDALVAEWTRMKSKSHTGVVKSQTFGDNLEWNKFVHEGIKKWRNYFNMWLKKQRPTMAIRYEDLKSDLVASVGRILDYLKFPYDIEELKEKLSKDFTTFKRKHGLVDFEHFTDEQKEVVRTEITQAVIYLRTENNGDTLGVEEYLRPPNSKS